LQETVRGFCEKECPPARLRQLFDGGEGHDPALWRGLGAMGLLGLAVPEAWGGAGLELLDLALVAEVLGHAALPAPFLGHQMVSLAIAKSGSDAQKNAWLPRLASGEAIGSVALAEDAATWEPETWRARVDGGRVTGEKCFAPHASHADVLLVGVAGGGLVLVERGAPRVEIADQGGVDRTRPIARVALEGAACDPLPGGEATARRVRDAGAVLLAADAFGAAWRLLQTTLAYTGARQQFGNVLTRFQAVKHQLANMATDIEPTRGLWWYAAHAFDEIPEESERAAAIAKAHVTDRALEVARGAVELHGGIGFTWECDVQIWFKRAMFDRAFLGTPELHRERSARLAGW
jgi:alkylation response protein AidB-like acyl-CoA dehydrogenase